MRRARASGTEGLAGGVIGVAKRAHARYRLPAVRGIVLAFETFESLSLEVEAGEGEQEIALSTCEGLRDGEWVLATFTIGEESIAVAACAVDRGDGAIRLTLEGRDWDMLSDFANADGPPSMPPASLTTPVEVAAPPDTRVMVVDDDLECRNVIGRMLRGAGFEIATAASAEEAFDRLRELTCDLIVLDWNLPGMTGIDFCKRLRRERPFGHVPVLFLTALSSRADVKEAFSAGADDFLSKPFRAPELAARVLGLLRRSRPPESPTSRG